MDKSGIKYIIAEQIYQHPDNPRKDLGDLDELSESIKKKGIMQNLTVIPGHWNENREWFEDGYTLIIGHRRFAAGKMAAVTEFPCRIISDMSQKDQVGTMLEENMQRNDLTIWEQANGFQMMLDLGATEEQIAEKTGFSRTTIKHRLNIAKLNQKELKKKEQDEGFQLSLKDLYNLEKIKNIKTRNKVLKESSSSKNLASRALDAARDEKREANMKVICKQLEKLGIEKAPENAKNELYSKKWEKIEEYNLDKEVPTKLKIPKKNEQMYWIQRYGGYVWLIAKPPKEEKKLSKFELERKEITQATKKIKAILRQSTSRRRNFIQDIIDGKIEPVKDDVQIKDDIWKLLLQHGTGIYESYLRKFFLPADEYRCQAVDVDKAKERVEGLSILHQMLIILHTAMTGIEDTSDYNGRFVKYKADELLKGYEILEKYGWYFEDESEKAVLDGTHELYKKEEKTNAE